MKYSLVSLMLLMNIFAVANAAGKKSDLHSDLDNGLVVCTLNVEKKIMCNCKQGTEACTDMIKNSCGEGGAHCAGGYCSCEAKDSMRRSDSSRQTESVGSGTVLKNPGTTPEKRGIIRDHRSNTSGGVLER